MRTRFGFNGLWLALTLCCLSGCMTRWMVPNDAESEHYVDSVVAEVLVPGTPLTYSKEATPELLRMFPAKRFAQASVQVQVTIGQPIGPGRTSGTTQVIVGSNDGTTKIAQYTTVTDLQRGTATIDVHATKRNGKWELTGVVINILPSSRK